MPVHQNPVKIPHTAPKTLMVPMEIIEFASKRGIKISFLVKEGFKSVRTGQTVTRLTEDLEKEIELREKYQMLYKETLNENEFLKKSISEYQLEITQLKTQIETSKSLNTCTNNSIVQEVS